MATLFKNRSKAERAHQKRKLQVRRLRPRLEPLEDRLTPADIGDTLNTALLTGLVANSTFTTTQKIGDGSFANLDVDLYKFDGQAGNVIQGRTFNTQTGQPLYVNLRVFDSTGIQVMSGDYYWSSSLEYILATSGCYYLGVSGSSNNSYEPTVPASGSYGSTNLDYRLDLKLIANPPDAAGDTLADAQAVTIGNTGASATGVIGDGLYVSRDVDFYKFQVAAGQVLTVQKSTPPSGTTLATALRLFDGMGYQLYSASGTDLIKYQFTSAGSYYLGISSTSNYNYNPLIGGSGNVGTTGNYQIDFTLTTPTADAAGDILANAKSISFDSGTANATGKIGDGLFPLRDVDMYSFQVTAGQVLTVQSSTPPGGTPMIPSLRVFDSTGSQLYNSFYSSQVRYQFLAGGTVYLGVSGLYNFYYDPNTGGSGYDSNQGDYRVDLALATPTADTAGQILSAAKVLDLGAGSASVASARIGNGLYPLRDVDLYSFRAARGQVLTVTTSLPSSGTATATYQRLFDSSGNELASSYGYSRLVYQFSERGTFYIGVSGYPNYSYDPLNAGTGFDHDTAGDYGMAVTLVTPTADAAGDELIKAQTLDVSSGSASATGTIGDGLYPFRDVDLYKFTAAQDQALVFKLSMPPGGPSGSFIMRLFDANGAELANRWWYYDQQINYKFSTTGTYYLGISAAYNGYYDPNVAGSGYDHSSWAAGDYILNISTPIPDAAGDSLADAQEVDVSSGSASVSGRIGDGIYHLRDVDLFRIVLTAAGQRLDVTTSLPPSGTANWTYLKVFNSSGVQLTYSSGYPGASYHRIQYQFAAAGTYYLGMSGNYYYDPSLPGSSSYDGGVSDYQLNVTLTTPPPESPANDDKASAQLLEFIGGTASVASAKIGNGTYPSRDVDLYKFAASQDQVVTVTAAVPSGGTAGTPYLRLFNSAGTQLTSLYYYGTLRFQVASTETYYLGVSGAGNYYYDMNTAGSGTDHYSYAMGDYSVDLSLATPAPDAAGQDLSNAASLAFSNGTASVTAKIGDGLYPLRDVDLYKFSVASPQIVTIQTSLPPGGQYMYSVQRLFDANGNQLGSTTFGYDTYSQISYRLDAGVDYYVGVSAYPNYYYDPRTAGTGTNQYSGYTGSDYRLNLSLTSVPPVSPDVGDSLGTALVTSLGPTNGTYNNTAKLGDGSYSFADVDLYRIEVTAGQGLVALTSFPPGGQFTYTALRLFDQYGNQLASNSFGNGINALLRYVFTSGGLYFLGVSGYPNLGYNANVAGSGSSAWYKGDYRLDLTLMAPTLDSVGDTIGTALGTGLIGPAEGTYTMASSRVGDGWYLRQDVDMYRVDATAGQAFTAQITQLTSNNYYNYTTLRLFDASGNQLAISNSGTYYWDPNPRIFEYTIPATGTYYIGVSGAGNSNYNPNTGGSGTAAYNWGNYKLALKLQTPVADQEGDTLATALDTQFGPANGTYTHSTRLGNGLYLGRDVDLYKFTASAGQVVTAQVQLPEGTYSSRILHLFDEVGNQIDGAWSLLESRISTSGTYYIGVSGYPNWGYDPNNPANRQPGETGEYSLTLSLITPTADAIGDTMAAAVDTRLGPNAGEYTLANSRIGDGLYVSRDVDIFRLKASTDQILRVSTALPAGGTPGTLYVRVFDSVGYWYYDAYAPNSESYLELSVPSSGTYYVAISGYPNYDYDPTVAGSGTIGFHGDYSLSISLDRLTDTPVGGGGKPLFKVTGSAVISKDVGFSNYYLYIDRVSVNAWLDVNGQAHGTMSWTSTWVPSPQHRWGINAGSPSAVRVTSLVVNGNTAHVEGIVVSGKWGVGWTVSFDIVDNGPGKSDLLNGQSLVNGNFTVRTVGGNGNALMADAVAPRIGRPVETLSPAQVTPLLTEAVSRWQAAGVDTTGLQDVEIRIADLPAATLGLADEENLVVWLDTNAAGWGWYVDRTPGKDTEFLTPGNQGEKNRMDLLTVLAHELGHLLGQDHETEGIMAETLAPGKRFNLASEPAAHFDNRAWLTTTPGKANKLSSSDVRDLLFAWIGNDDDSPWIGVTVPAGRHKLRRRR